MGPLGFETRARTFGAAGIALDATLEEGWVAEWRALKTALPVVAVEGPCPRPRTPRAARLATTDKDERRQALESLRATLRLAVDVGAPTVVLRLGALEIGSAWQKVVKDFARRNLARSHVERMLEDRVKAAPRALDLARYGLEPILDDVASAGLTLGLSNRARWFEIPDTAELGVLFEDFRGAPLAAWYDAAAAHAREALGFGRAAEWLAVHGKHAVGAFFGDACGLRAGLAWGRGEIDAAAVEAALPETVPQVVHLTADVTDEELAASIGAA